MAQAAKDAAVAMASEAAADKAADDKAKNDRAAAKQEADVAAAEKAELIKEKEDAANEEEKKQGSPVDPAAPPKDAEKVQYDNDYGYNGAVAAGDYANTGKMIGEEGYDPWVYKFSMDAMPPIAGWKSAGKVGATYGWHPSNQHPNPPAHGSYGSDHPNMKALA